MLPGATKLDQGQPHDLHFLYPSFLQATWYQSTHPYCCHLHYLAWKYLVSFALIFQCLCILNAFWELRYWLQKWRGERAELLDSEYFLLSTPACFLPPSTPLAHPLPDPWLVMGHEGDSKTEILID